jgi:hypothetical protein
MSFVSASIATNDPLIADARLVVFLGDLALLLADIRPNFVHLNALAGQITHLFVQKTFAAVPDIDHEAHDRVAVRVGHTFGRADRIAFHQGSDDLGLASEGKAIHGKPLEIKSVCTIIDTTLNVNRGAYMNFKSATDALFERVSHEELAGQLGVSVAAIRQARLDAAAKAHRTPPKYWERAAVALAEKRIRDLHELVGALDHIARIRESSK